jgi:hypothetical protein
MGIKHLVPSGLPTGLVSGKVAGDDWRADHSAPPFDYLMYHGASTGTMSGPTAATGGTELINAPQTRLLADLAVATQMRINVGIRVLGAGGTSAHLQVQYSTNGATQTTWANAHNTGSGCDIRAGVANTLLTSGWVDLVAGAKADTTYLRAAWVVVGTLTTAPTVASIRAQFR